MAAPAPEKPAQMAMARARSPGGKTLAKIDRVAGMTKAAPTPISARVAISWLALWAKVDSSEAKPTVARPSCSAPLRPKRSPSAPDGRSRQAKTME